MKVVFDENFFDENFFDEIDHFHPNFDESVPNRQDHDWPKSVKKLAKVGLAKVGLAKVGHDRGIHPSAHEGKAAARRITLSEMLIVEVASDKVTVFGVFGCSYEANRVEGNARLVSHFIVDMGRHHSECLFPRRVVFTAIMLEVTAWATPKSPVT